MVLGIGNEERSDDGAGTRVARLVRRLCRTRPTRVPCLAVPGGAAPENFTGAMRRFSPDRVVMVDAVSAGLPPGQVETLRPEDLGGISLSSHTMPLGILRDYLRGAGFADQIVLGIQPARIDLGGIMSKEVRQASRSVARALFRAVL